MSHSDNTEDEIDFLDFLANKIDALLCQAALTDLQNIALKVGVTCDTKDKTKRQSRGFITKLYEGIIEDLENTKEEKKNLPLEIIDAINQDNSEIAEQHVENESNTELPKADTKTEVKTGEASGGNLHLLENLDSWEELGCCGTSLR